METMLRTISSSLARSSNNQTNPSWITRFYRYSSSDSTPKTPARMAEYSLYNYQKRLYNKYPEGLASYSISRDCHDCLSFDIRDRRFCRIADVVKINTANASKSPRNYETRQSWTNLN